ncbi:DUF2993 domain-containing protein [Lysobacter korlensis]|uniref:DUF2993 domain-containing protein n=1 Tax=Lysobacter korlensis TaxID=553636 RepID=A0ABV6S2X2_9GAMM
MTAVLPPARIRRRRRKAPWVLGGLILLVLLLVAAYVVAEILIRDYATERVKTEVAEGLALESEDDVGVQFTGSLVLQALMGRLDQADVTVDEATFGPLTGDLEIRAHGVPVDSSQPVDRLDVRLMVSEDDVQQLAEYITAVRVADITLDEPEIVAETEFSILAATVPVRLGLEPSAESGRLAFTPSSVELAGRRLTADELRESEFGVIAGPLLEQRQVCVEEYLPKAFALLDVRVVGDELVATLTGADVRLTAAELQDFGTCS